MKKLLHVLVGSIVFSWVFNVHAMLQEKFEDTDRLLSVQQQPKHKKKLSSRQKRKIKDDLQASAAEESDGEEEAEKLLLEHLVVEKEPEEEQEPSYEPRFFKSTLNFKLDLLKPECHINPWHLKHHQCIKSCGDYLLKEKRLPRNIAFAQLSYHKKSGKIASYDIPKFFMSAFKESTNAKKFQSFVKSKLSQDYQDYSQSYLNVGVSTSKEFLSHLKGILDELPDDLPEKRNLHNPKYLHSLDYNHSEQGVFVYVMYQDEAWDALFSDYNVEEIDQITLNIISYRDPCRACASTGHQLSKKAMEIWLKKRFTSFLEKKVKNLDALERLIKKTKFFIQISGIKQHDSTIILRRDRASDSDFKTPIYSLRKVPKICCAVTGDL